MNEDIEAKKKKNWGGMFLIGTCTWYLRMQKLLCIYLVKEKTYLNVTSTQISLQLIFVVGYVYCIAVVYNDIP